MAGPHLRGIEQYLSSHEEIRLETRQHAFAIAAAFLRAIGLLIPLTLIMWGVAGIPLLQNDLGLWMVRMLVVAMFAVLGWLAWKVLEWDIARVVVTTEKVMHVHGVLRRRIASTSIVKVAELTIDQPLFGRIFGYGSLVVDAPGGAVPLHGLQYLPDPAGIYRLIISIARRERSLEGGGVVDVTERETRYQEGETTVLAQPPDSDF